jgi:hypothetical protein
MNQSVGAQRDISSSRTVSMEMEVALTNLRDTLLVHSSVEHRPCYSARILALEEE